MFTLFLFLINQQTLKFVTLSKPLIHIEITISNVSLGRGYLKVVVPFCVII